MSNWRDSAACLDQDADAWFPLPGENPHTAKKVCRSCPVRNECLEYALRNGLNEFGVFGGLTPNERQKLTRKASA